MRMSKTRMLLLAAAAGFHFNASAGMLDPHEYRNGNLTWLQLHETAGLSLSDFSAGIGGWNTRYRLATNAEIGTLFSAIGLSTQDYTPSNPGASTFIFSLGGAFGTGGDMSRPFAAGRGLGWYAMAGWTDGENGQPLSADCQAYTTCAISYVEQGAQDINSRGDGVGLFLVQQEAGVPEPATLGLMGLAGALLAAQRRRQRA